MFIKVLATGYFSKQNTRTPVKIGIVAMVVNMVMNLLLFKPYGHVGLAVATAVSATVNAGLLWGGLVRNGTLVMSSRWFWWSARALLSAAVMISAIYWSQPAIETWQSQSTFERSWQLVWLIVLGAGGYLVTLFILGFRIKDVKSE